MRPRCGENRESVRLFAEINFFVHCSTKALVASGGHAQIPAREESMPFSIHIPTSCERALVEALDGGALHAVRAYLRLVAELAETASPNDEVWSRLDRSPDGYFRWFGAQCEVLFEIDRGHRAIAVREVRIPRRLAG